MDCTILNLPEQRESIFEVRRWHASADSSHIHHPALLLRIKPGHQTQSHLIALMRDNRLDTYDSFLLAEFTSLFTTPVQLLLPATEKDDRFRLNPTQEESHFSVVFTLTSSMCSETRSSPAQASANRNESDIKIWIVIWFVIWIVIWSSGVHACEEENEKTSVNWSGTRNCFLNAWTCS